MATSTYTKLDSYTVSSATPTITFSNIPQTYTDLVIKMSVRSEYGSTASNISLLINGLNFSSALFRNQYFSGNGATVTADEPIYTGGDANFIGFQPGSTATANAFANSELYFANYTSANYVKNCLVETSMENVNATAYTTCHAINFNSTSPITSISIKDAVTNHAVGSTFTLYGVFNQDVASVPSAPTIGTATDLGTNDSASVTFTGVSGAASYTMTSSPSSITATGTTSPIVVSGLSLGTAYTFSCTANNPFGVSGASAASNSVTLAGVASYELIGTANLSGTTTTLTGLPTSGYKHLQIFVMSQHNYTNFAGPVYLQFNGDTNSVYTWHQMLSDYSQTAPLTYNSTASIGYKMGTHPGTYQAGYWGTYTIDVLDFLSPNKYKSIFSNGGDGGLSYPRNWLSSGSWKNLSPINTITISTVDGSFVTGSQVQVWGIR